VIDEINHILLNNISKVEGDIVTVLLNKERIESFSKLWKETYLEHYEYLKQKEKFNEVQ